jgi:hypothetical protein
MKKVMVSILMAIFIFSLVACDGNEEVTNSETEELQVLEPYVPQETDENDETDEHDEIDETDEQRAPDFRSVLDTETGESLSLGDSPERFEGVLGEPFLTDEWAGVTTHQYGSYGELIVIFWDGRAESISTANWVDSGRRFQFRYLSFYMTEMELEEDFTLVEGEARILYDRYYDEEGNVVPYEDKVYIARVSIHPPTREVSEIEISRHFPSE